MGKENSTQLNSTPGEAAQTNDNEWKCWGKD